MTLLPPGVNERERDAMLYVQPPDTVHASTRRRGSAPCERPLFRAVQPRKLHLKALQTCHETDRHAITAYYANNVRISV